MRRALVALVLGFAGCGGPHISSVIEDYHRALDARDRHPEWSQREFEEVCEDGAEVLKNQELEAIDRAVVASVRIRACVEAGHVEGAEETIAAHSGVFRTLNPDLRTPGDVAGIALLKARVAKTPDAALVELTTARERVSGPRTQAFMDLKIVEALLAKAAVEKDEERGKRALETAIATCDARKEGPFAERFGTLRAEAQGKLNERR